MLVPGTPERMALPKMGIPSALVLVPCRVSKVDTGVSQNKPKRTLISESPCFPASLHVYLDSSGPTLPHWRIDAHAQSCSLHLRKSKISSVTILHSLIMNISIVVYWCYIRNVGTIFLIRASTGLNVVLAISVLRFVIAAYTTNLHPLKRLALGIYCAAGVQQGQSHHMLCNYAECALSQNNLGPERYLFGVC